MQDLQNLGAGKSRAFFYARQQKTLPGQGA
jgi:hypothetical protein